MNHSQKSAVDGRYLPLQFTCQHSDSTLVSYLNGHISFAPDYWWRDMDHYDRGRVLSHLQRIGRVRDDVRLITNRYGQNMTRTFAMGVGDGRSTDFATDFGKPLHEGPNGGKRMLPSVYTQLRDTWLRSTGQTVSVRDMAEDHALNCLNLLKESHSNHLGGASQCLGVMARHFGNNPRIVELAIEMLKELEKIDVEEMYPVWTALAERVKPSEPTKPQTTININVDTSKIRLTLEKLIERVRTLEIRERAARGD